MGVYESVRWNIERATADKNACPFVCVRRVDSIHQDIVNRGTEFARPDDYESVVLVLQSRVVVDVVNKEILEIDVMQNALITRHIDAIHVGA